MEAIGKHEKNKQFLRAMGKNIAAKLTEYI